jgi:DNA-binding transcriptional LysR family regulator
MKNPDLNLLIALNALLSEKSVVGAAHRLKLSTSAMSRTLSRLRSVTGDPLLVRAGQRMVLTPYAQEVRERTQNTVFEAVSILRPDSEKLDISRLERTFTIRANDGFVEAFAPQLIAKVAEEAPLVRLRFAPKPEKNTKDLREGLIDLEIGVLGDMGPEIRIQSLFHDRFVGVVRQGHPLEVVDDITAEQYASFGHVVASRRGLTTGPVDEALNQLGLQRKIAAVVPSFPAALSVASASELIALVPASLLNNQMSVNHHHVSATLRAFELPVKTEGITISQMWHPRLQMDLAHLWLRTLVRKVCHEPLSNEPN